MTRYIVIWNPGFESGMSRHETVNALHTSWQSRAPQLIKRRTVSLKTVISPDLFGPINAWLLKTWGRSMPKQRPLSIVAISDPDWETAPEKWQASFEAMRAGYASVEPKPQFCVLGFETTEEL